jgi:hypothetical protein
MKKILIGNTGLVGGVLRNQINFDFEFNSKTIAEYQTIVPNGCDLYLSCLPATKWMVNKNITHDFNNMMDIISILGQKKYNSVILISTIDVYTDSPLKSDEDYNPNFKQLSYGSNRLLFEELVDKFITKNSYKIFRLPALFTKNLKKNILFDLLTNNQVENINYNSSFQWYSLDNLCRDITKFSNLKEKQKIYNLFTEPIETSDILGLFPEHKDKVILKSNRFEYNFTTNLDESGYIQTKKSVLSEIINFINEFRS